MAAPLILARTFAAAHAFAQEELGLPFGRYRVVNSPATIKAVRGVDLYLVPGWQNRFDRFAMKGALRYCHLNVIEVPVEQAEAPDERWANTAYTHTVAERYNRLVTLASAEAAIANVGEIPVFERPEGVEPITSEAPVQRRRRRCKECGLLVEPDEVEEHAASHGTEGL